jgi:flagellin
MDSINTNASALTGVAALNAASKEVAQAQDRVSTGLKVASAKDDGAAWAIAQTMRSQGASLATVSDSLQRAKSAIDVAMSAGQQVADILSQMKALALTGTETDIDPTSRKAIEDQYDTLWNQIKTVVNGASFDGINILQSTTPTSFLENPDGGQKLTIPAQSWDWSPWSPGPVIMLRGYSLDQVTYANYCLSDVQQSISNVEGALTNLGSYSQEIDRTIASNSTRQQNLTTGIGDLVDADMGQESAKLQAAQSKQQLAAKALAIANAAPQWILSLFK